MVPGSLEIKDNVSDNLSKIPPLQLIEIISNLKILANQDSSRWSQIENFLKTNKDLTLAVSQALLEMGLINYDVVTKVIQKRSSTNLNPMINPGINRPVSVSNSNSGSNSNSASNNNSVTGTPSMNNNYQTPINTMPIPTTAANNVPMNPSMQPRLQNNTMGMNVPMGMPPPPFQQQQPQQNFMNNRSPMPPFMPQPQPQPPVPPPFMQQPQQPQHPMPVVPAPPAPNAININMVKLNQLPENQQQMIKQVLSLTTDQVKLLPPDQQAMVENFKKEYLL